MIELSGHHNNVAGNKSKREKKEKEEPVVLVLALYHCGSLIKGTCWNLGRVVSDCVKGKIFSSFLLLSGREYVFSLWCFNEI